MQNLKSLFMFTAIFKKTILFLKIAVIQIQLIVLY